MGLISMHGDGGAAAEASCFPAARRCDCCEVAAAVLFCRADSAFLCIACDSKLHIDPQARRERVWMCEVCEQAAAVVSCRADAAVLCSECDRDIHSANPLSRRHDRVPVVPFFENAESVFLDSGGGLLTDQSLWVSAKLPAGGPDTNKSIEFLFSDSDQLLDFEILPHLLSDCVVPAQTTSEPPVPAVLSPHRNYSSENRFEIDFTTANVNSYNNNSYTTSSLSHSVSSSSIDLGIVPDGSSALSDMSYPFSSNDMVGNQGFRLDREARVLRYREKRKNRRFQKTVRYASRKAYAETRPRIKGRFAKRTDGELETDPVSISGSPDDCVSDARYAVVMSF